MRQQEIGLRLEQLRRVSQPGVSARIMQHEEYDDDDLGIRSHVNPAGGTFRRETIPAYSIFNRRGRFTSSM